jgi:hypothetical protein
MPNNIKASGSIQVTQQTNEASVVAPTKGFDLAASMTLLFTSRKTRIPAYIVSIILGGIIMYQWGSP